MTKLTPSEEQLQKILEAAGVTMLKGSYPDFIVANKDESKFCLVEVKKRNHEYLSKNQEKTMKFLKKLGIPCITVHLESIIELLKVEQAIGELSFPNLNKIAEVVDAAGHIMSEEDQEKHKELLAQVDEVLRELENQKKEKKTT